MSFFIMHSGTEIDLENISLSDIRLDDIAHHLAKICRFGGCLPLGVHYSVANHSIMLYEYAKAHKLPDDICRALLMHDASEAYLGDVNGIVKKYLPDYKLLERRLTEMIEDKYGLAVDDQQGIVHSLDQRILMDECAGLIPWTWPQFVTANPALSRLGIDIIADNRFNDIGDIKDYFLYCCVEAGVWDDDYK